MAATPLKIANLIAAEIKASAAQVSAAVGLIDEGATVPFIARYRKEATGGLDDTQLRTLEERLRYLRELEERRTAILASLVESQKLTPELEDAIRSADSKTRLEDLYAPHRPKKRSKAQIAREQGLEPLADALLEFAGSVMVISHDRWFLDRIATHILAFEGDSTVVWYEGNYQDYEADRHRRLGTAADTPHRVKYRKLTR